MNLLDEIDIVAQSPQTQYIAQPHPRLTPLIELVRDRATDYYQCHAQSPVAHRALDFKFI